MGVGIIPKPLKLDSCLAPGRAPRLMPRAKDTAGFRPAPEGGESHTKGRSSRALAQFNSVQRLGKSSRGAAAAMKSLKPSFKKIRKRSGLQIAGATPCPHQAPGIGRRSAVDFAGNSHQRRTTPPCLLRGDSHDQCRTLPLAARPGVVLATREAFLPNPFEERSRLRLCPEMPRRPS